MKKIKQFLKDIFAPKVYIHYHGVKPFGKRMTQDKINEMWKHFETSFEEMNKSFTEMGKLFDDE